MKVFRVHSWSHVLVEGFCMINVDYDKKSSKHVYTIPTKGENVEKWSKDRFNPKNWVKEPNPDYDPTVQPDVKPEYCKGHVCIDCLCHGDGMCPHFNWCGVEKKVKRKFRKMIRKIYKT